jgi:hypothetical protein
MNNTSEFDDIPLETLRQWETEFEEAARWSVEERIRRDIVKMYRPILDDAPYRSFESMEQYRNWCEENLPASWGFGRSPKPE